MVQTSRSNQHAGLSLGRTPFLSGRDDMTNIIKIRDVLKQLTPQVPDDAMAFEDFTRQFCQDLAKPRKHERRERERVELPPVPAEVQPLNDAFEPEGAPFAAIVRSISAKGMGLMFGKPVHSKYLQVVVSASGRDQLKTVIELKHCTEAGIMIGGASTTELVCD